jgi:xanthine dehydrogenase accessory factor
MKLWQETERILDIVLRLASEGRSAALARVVAIEGSAYRRPGAKLLVPEDGRPVGGVSGGCLEDDVRLIGLDVVKTGVPVLRRYDTKDENRVLGLGLGCGGSVDIFIQRVSPEDARETWAEVRRRLRESEPFGVVTAIDGAAAGRMLLAGNAWTAGSLRDPKLDDAARGGALAAVRRRSSSVQTLEGVRVFFEVLSPPPRLLVCGAGDDAIPLVALAASIGFRVLVADHRDAVLTPARFPDARELLRRRPEDGLPAGFAGPDAFAVVKCHSFNLDGGWVRALLAADVGYVGVLGPREDAEDRGRRLRPGARAALRSRRPRPRRGGTRAGRPRDRRRAPRGARGPDGRTPPTQGGRRPCLRHRSALRVSSSRRGLPAGWDGTSSSSTWAASRS